MGSWVTYGIGSESADLPGFVVLQSGPRGPRGGAVNWGNGFLPSAYQGVPLRGGGEPILNLSTPEGISPRQQRRTIEAVGALNHARLDVTADPEIATRITAYEVAFRMQSSAPELIDLGSETRETLKIVRRRARQAVVRQQLPARPPAGRAGRALRSALSHRLGPPRRARPDLDPRPRSSLPRYRPALRGLDQDLKSRGLLENTLVVWGGEFGRTPMGEIREHVGRNHHIDAMTMWMAGGGVKAGFDPGRDRRVRIRPGLRPRPTSTTCRPRSCTSRPRSHQS